MPKQNKKMAFIKYFSCAFLNTYSEWCPVCLRELRKVVDQLLGLLPSEARICDRLAVYAASRRLASVHEIALDHEPFHKVPDGRILVSGMHDVLRDPYLFFELLP